MSEEKSQYERDTEDVKRTILRTLERNYAQYIAHVWQRDKLVPRETYIGFTIPYFSPTMLYIESGISHDLAYHFDSELYDLINESKVARVTEPTACFAYPNDFRDADIGDVFLNCPELLRAYQKSVRDTASGKYRNPVYST